MRESLGRAVPKGRHAKLRDMFARYDKSGNGTLSIVELRELWRALFPSLDDHE
eukprot:gene5474-11241_t